LAAQFRKTGNRALAGTLAECFPEVCATPMSAADVAGDLPKHRSCGDAATGAGASSAANKSPELNERLMSRSLTREFVDRII
jgi:hypothetical protein